jgi:hypothetical protein
VTRLQKYWPGLLLLLLCWLLHRQSSDKQWVEQTYVSGWFLPIQGLLGGFFSLFPFSLGDIFYGLLNLLFLGSLIIWVKKYKSQEGGQRKSLIIKFLYFNCCLGATIYLIFNILWGNNYNRASVATQLDLRVKPYSELTEIEIGHLNAILLQKVNANDSLLRRRGEVSLPAETIFQEAYESYDSLSVMYPAMKPLHRSLKPSLWAWLGNFSGFTGYYNPFTFEAQVNTDIPSFLQPYVACHEIAHQLGYAREMEANFVGYLAASRSPEPFFRYSVYLDLFLYANGMLYTKDSLSAGEFRSRLNDPVKMDLAEWSAFRKKHRNEVEPYVTRAYDLFLKRNNQPDGMGSYAMVTAFLLACLDKYGDI